MRGKNRRNQRTVCSSLALLSKVASEGAHNLLLIRSILEANDWETGDSTHHCSSAGVIMNNEWRIYLKLSIRNQCIICCRRRCSPDKPWNGRSWLIANAAVFGRFERRVTRQTLGTLVTLGTLGVELWLMKSIDEFELIRIHSKTNLVRSFSCFAMN